MKQLSFADRLSSVTLEAHERLLVCRAVLAPSACHIHPSRCVSSAAMTRSSVPRGRTGRTRGRPVADSPQRRYPGARSVRAVELTLSARGDARAATIWERYATIARWRTWAPHIRGVEANAARIAPGVTGTVLGPVGLRVRFHVDAVDEPRSWSWTARVGPVRLALDHGVEADGRTTLRMRGLGPVVLGYAPVARWALARLVRA